MGAAVLRTFQFRLRPNATQRVMLEYILEDNCETYNAALRERRDAWRMEKKSVGRYDQQKQLTELRKDPRFAVIAADIQRDALRRIELAFSGFFRRCKSGEKPGFPRFRSPDRYTSFSFGECNRTAIRERSIKVPNLGYIRARGGRPIGGTPKVCRIKRHGKRWTASVVCDIGPAPEKVAVSHAVGIDVGLTSLVTLSDGTTIENPRWTRKHERKIVEANRALSRKQERSKNRIRAREALRRAHQRAADARANYLHHVSKWLVQNYDLIAFEKLQIENLAHGNRAKSILDAAWGILLFQVAYKAESAGKWAVPVNPRGTSIRCSGCGADVRKTLQDRQHICACGVSLNRDHNAALNIKGLGLSLAGATPESISIPIKDGDV